ncbi:MAG: class I SAM-dependent methyltransferase [Candidatus Thermoplasmatota archaeon]|nr:class I SAM-dependent methyltransferase [Candidatus Thermoplasmatota archaeon]
METNYKPVIKALGIDAVEYEAAKNESQEIRKYVSSKIGARQFWQVSEDELVFIYSITRSFRPQVVVETGVGPGTTSLAFISALEKFGGRLYSFDLGKKYGEEEKGEPVGFVVPQDMRRNWNLTFGDSKLTLGKGLAEIGRVDLFLHDSEHTKEHVLFELNTVLPYLSDRSLILIDNYDWTEAPGQFAQNNKMILTHVVDDLCAICRKT